MSTYSNRLKNLTFPQLEKYTKDKRKRVVISAHAVQNRKGIWNNNEYYPFPLTERFDAIVFMETTLPTNPLRDIK